MKVKELVSLLLKYNQEMPIFIDNCSEGFQNSGPLEIKDIYTEKVVFGAIAFDNNPQGNATRPFLEKSCDDLPFHYGKADIRDALILLHEESEDYYDVPKSYFDAEKGEH